MIKSSIILWLLAFSVFELKAQTVQDKRPNFIVIYTDDQRQDALGTNSNEVIITPMLDKAAREAVSFSNANVVFSLCSPSRAALLTGRYGSANGVLGLGSALNPGERTIADYLKEAGYQTAISGKWHIDQHPKEVGFDLYSFFEGNGPYYNRLIHGMEKDVKTEEHCDIFCVDWSINFLTNVVHNDKPFFLFHCTQLPHMNGNLKWVAKPETLAKYNSTDMPVAKNRLDDLSAKPDYLKIVRNRTQAKKYGYPKTEAIQRHTKEYYSVITEMDGALGRLLKTVDKLGMRENTYIIFMSDNGWMLGDHGFTSKVLPYRPSTQVPLFILGPGLSPRTEEGIALNIDIAPTLLDLAGIKPPANMQGQSLLPILLEKSDNLRDAFVYEGLGLYGGAKPNLTVISKDLRYITTFEDKSLHKIAHRELYNQYEDPDELVNLMNFKGDKETVKKFDALISQHMEDILKK